MHPLMHVVLAQCYFSTAFYPDAERVIWMRSQTGLFDLRRTDPCLATFFFINIAT